MEEHSSLDSNSSNKEEEIVPSETIPFVMMFIFLNYDVIFKSISLEARRNLSKFNKKQNFLRRSIMKAANVCAKKFCITNHGLEDEYFSAFCSKKLKPILPNISVPSTQASNSNENILDIFEQMFYSHQLESETFHSSDNDVFEDLIRKKEERISLHQLDDGSNYTCKIPQLDGNISESSEDDEKIAKTLFAVKCEENEIVQVLSFFRSFNFLWNSLVCHKLCLTKPS